MDKEQMKLFIAKRAAKEMKDGFVVNLGIGIPTLAASFIPEGVDVTIHSENGIVGATKCTQENKDALNVVDASGQPAAIKQGGCFIDSSLSFGLIRGGHIDLTMLGGLEVDKEGSLANWLIPGKRMPGMGGAMDLLVGAKRVVVTMEHTAKGNFKILNKCKLPYTAVNCVNRIITEMAVIDVEEDGLHLVEYNPEFTIEDIIAATESELIISENLEKME